MDLCKTALKSERLTLKSFTSTGSIDVYQVVTPTLTRFMAFAPSSTIEAFAEIWRTWFPRMAAGTGIFLVIRLTETGEFLGILGLHNVGAAEPEMGIWIKESKHGCGYGREAVATVVAWAPDILVYRQ